VSTLQKQHTAPAPEGLANQDIAWAS